jgi:hypothetical protein
MAPSDLPMPLPDLAQSAERLVYRIAGLPVAIGALLGASASDAGDQLHYAFAHRYWHPEGAGEWFELVAAMVSWPLALLLATAWFTLHNGPVISRRHGKSLGTQAKEQVRFYFSAGVLPPWYYIFQLHDDGASRASSFIQRFETKTSYFRVLKRRKGTPLNDKCHFAEFCLRHGIRSVETLVHLEGKCPSEPLPDRDLFIKPVVGRGGRGAERWDCVGPSDFEDPSGKRLSGDALLSRLVSRSRREEILVQPRLRPHPDLARLTAGALPTVRVLTCLGEKREPEVVAAMIRTSFGENRTVDNLHAGGIGALVDLDRGTLSKASNLGSDARLGWFSTHPDTQAPIEGARLPCWEQVKGVAVAAHRHFNDRVVVGWDIAILEDGPILIEGNGNPDLDILQRFMRIGLREHRFADLLAHHLKKITVPEH